MKPRSVRKNPFLQELSRIKEKRTADRQRVKEDALSRASTSDSHSDNVWEQRLQDSIKELEIQKGSERTYKIMKKLSPFMDSLKSLMQICEGLVQDAPFGVSVAFTGLRMILFLTFDVQNQLDIIMEALEEVGGMLKFCQRLMNYDSDPYFQKLLIRSYKDIIRFWVKASDVFSGNIVKVMARNMVNSLRTAIKEALDKMRTHSLALKDYAYSTGLLRANEASKEAAQDREKKLKHDLALWIRGNDNLGIDDDAAEQLGRRHEGTCKWVMEEPLFEHWRDAVSGSVLWYHAPPGSGKSVLAATVIDYLKKRNEKVAAFFYSYSSDTKRHGLNGLRSLALQLLNMTQHVPDTASKLFDDEKIYNTTLQSSSIATALIHQLLSPLDHVYLVIDGLDECPDNDRLIDDLRGLVQQKFYATVKWLFLSRYNDSFRSKMSEMGALELRPKSDVISMDIQTYVTSTLTCEHCFSEWSDENERNFLYARFVCETLRGNGTLRNGDIESALEQFPASLTSYYTRSIDEIARRSDNEQKLARMAFIILVAAKQSVTFGELMDALSVKMESPDNQRSRLRRPDEIRNLCGPLITLEGRDEDPIETHIVKFYHKTIEDFLLQDPNMLKLESIDSRRYFVTENDAHREMGMLCLTYLMDQQYSECQDLEALVKSVDKGKDQAFLRYAATFWCQHLNEAKPTPIVVEQVTQFLKSKAFWTCIGVQSHTAPHLFGTYIALKSGSYGMSSKAYKWNSGDAFGLPLPEWLDSDKRFKSPLVTSPDFELFEGGEWTFFRADPEPSQAEDKRARILHARWVEKDEPLKCQQPASDENQDEMTDTESESEAEVESDSDGDSASDISDSSDGYESITTDSSVDDEGQRIGQCIVILQPQKDPYWTKPWMSSAIRWDKVGFAMHPYLPLLAFTHTSLDIELVDLDKKTQETKHLPEPVNVNGKPASSTRELRFSSCGKYLHCLIITFVNASRQTNCQVTVATYCFDPDGDNNNACLLTRPPVQCNYSFADKLANIALPLTLTYWAEDSVLIALPPLTCDAKIIRVKLSKDGANEDTQIKTLRAPIYFPSSTPHRDPWLLQRTSFNSDGKYSYLHLALGALFPTKRESSPAQPRPEVQDGTRIGRPMDQASPPVFLRWKIPEDDGWRSWDADLDGKSSDLKRETPVWEVLRGGYVDPNKPFSVPIRFGLDWTRKGYLSC
ncbi:hypothetical protein E8E14_014449 [Neopestalotiopsis sp. 37M]|nr:hypothetical protein E8E14_014449 [Neopestalotiopsis sp. 37M]